MFRNMREITSAQAYIYAALILASAILVAVAVLFYIALFVWPTPYEYLERGGLRVHRFSGKVQIFSGDHYEDLGSRSGLRNARGGSQSPRTRTGNSTLEDLALQSKGQGLTDLLQQDGSGRTDSGRSLLQYLEPEK